MHGVKDVEGRVGMALHRGEKAVIRAEGDPSVAFSPDDIKYILPLGTFHGFGRVQRQDRLHKPLMGGTASIAFTPAADEALSFHCVSKRGGTEFLSPVSPLSVGVAVIKFQNSLKKLIKTMLGTRFPDMVGLQFLAGVKEYS